MLMLGFGLDISGIASLPIAITLWSIGVLILIIWVIYKMRLKTSPLVDQEDIESLGIYPATEDDIHWIANEEKDAYRGDDVMPFGLLKRWYKKHPACFWMIKRKSGERVGNIYMLPIVPTTMEKLINGQIQERDIVSKDLYSKDQSDQIRSLHICSLVCRKDSRGCRTCLISIPIIVRSICNPLRLETIYSLEASPEGHNLLHRNGFSEICKKEGRKDKHPMYSIGFRDLVKNIASRIPEGEKQEFKKLLNQSPNPTDLPNQPIPR